jgi:hypothetical protein
VRITIYIFDKVDKLLHIKIFVVDLQIEFFEVGKSNGYQNFKIFAKRHEQQRGKVVMSTEH